MQISHELAIGVMWVYVVIRSHVKHDACEGDNDGWGRLQPLMTLHRIGFNR